MTTRIDPTDDSQWNTCQRCGKQWQKHHIVAGVCWYCQQDELRREADVQRLTRILGGSRAYREMTAERFQVSTDNQAAFDAAQQFDHQTQNLYFYGRCGVGKTHLTAVVLRRLFEEGRQVELIQPSTLIRSARGREGYEEEQALDRLVRMDCLVIDDLGAERSTEYAVQLLYEIVNRRWLQDRNGLIVTSNLSLRDLAGKIQDDRLLSRLAGLCQVVAVGGHDWRRRHGV